MESFTEFGTVIHAKINQWPNGQSKGFGFVLFETKEQAQRAIEGMNGASFHGKTLTVCPFQKNSEREEGKAEYNNLYFRNITKADTEVTLKGEFEKYGEVTSIIITTNNGEQRYGYVCFKTMAEAA